ncbi:MAG: ral nucleoside transport system ATP-binding protein [Thermoleophilales bacterium]|nr:ral nucleoside transport system ATP-binding protein [Thermoleophilales bacterium]
MTPSHDRTASADEGGTSHDGSPALELEGIVKVYPGVVANDGVTFDVRRGEIMAVLGENGAGKSTLMKIVYGFAAPDAGRIAVGGREVRIDSPRAAMRLGLGMVSQEFMLVEALSVAENVALAERQAGRLRGLRRVDLATIERRVAELSEEHGLSLDPRAIVGDLPMGLRQRVEIVKALYHGAELLILDEPTAVLTPDEADRLADVMRNLRASGRSVLFISHKLDEVMAVADRITVLRGGRVVARLEASETDKIDLSRHMVGEEIRLERRERAPSVGEVAVRLVDVGVRRPGEKPALSALSLELGHGEILGVAGVEGNGQTELAELVAGLIAPSSGTVEVLGVAINGQGPRELADLGVSYVPADRSGVGLVPEFTVSENLLLKSYRTPPFSRRGLLNLRHIAATGERLVREFDIRIASAQSEVGSLSGGGLQRVILAREIAIQKSRVIVAMHPTRGLDVKSTQYVHEQLLWRRNAGAAVLLISADLDEVLGLSDRVAVIESGTIQATAPAEQATREWLGPLMGGSAGGAAA